MKPPHTISPAAIDALLPQTQCRKCGYDGCMPYAEAIARGRADVNRCPPGGDEGVRALAQLVGVEAKPIDPACGNPGPRTIAVIDETHCIGCTLCIQACPVDAIVGAAKLMHTVIRDACTGCDLCVPPCPVDCIAMVEREPQPDAATRLTEAQAARARHEARKRRLAERRDQQRAAAAKPAANAETAKRETIARAMERARMRLAARAGR